MDFRACNDSRCSWFAVLSETAEAGDRYAFRFDYRFLLHAVRDSLRVMLLPSYIVAVILFILLIIQLMKSVRGNVRTASAPYKKKSRASTWLRGALILILAAFSGVGSGLLTRYFPAFTMPEPTGQFAIGTFSQQLVDESREETLSPENGDKRELMINVWYPVDPEAANGIKPESYPAELGKRSVSFLASRPRCSVTWIRFRHMW